MENYEFTIESVARSSHEKITNFWQPGEDRNKPYAEESMKYHYFWEAVESSKMSRYVSKYGAVGLAVTMKKNKNDAFFPEMVQMKDNIQLTFNQIFLIESEKAGLRESEEIYTWCDEHVAILEKCAQEYAKRYHNKMMRDLKNVDFYL